jgi:hypothetical protein
MRDKIFVQIASYRDPELIPTINNCLSNAKYPQNLVFCIAWQHSSEDVWDNLEIFKNDVRFKIIDIHYSDSKGACWARSKTQKYWNGEKYSLQIDSHHRFVKNWDELLISMWTMLEDNKAILTGYPPNYSPNIEESQWDYQPQICNVYSFNDGLAVARPRSVENYENREFPVKGVHVSAGFIFSLGDLNKKILYDPELYFMGEEANLTLRYFTHGYNLYHPHKLILHHFYTRENYKKHWTDHKNWGSLSLHAKKRLTCLIKRNNDVDLTGFDLGKERTLEDFKKYSGIDYENEILHDDTIQGIEPPCSNSEIGWDQNIKIFEHTINWDYNLIPKCDDTRFWGIFVCDQNKKALFRIDLETNKFPEIISGIQTTLDVKFNYKEKFETPTYIMIWPYSESKKWIENVYLPLQF